MLVPRKKTSMVHHNSPSSGKSNNRCCEMIGTPKKLHLEEHLYLLQNTHSSPSDTDVEDNNDDRSRPRANSSFQTRGSSNYSDNNVWSMTSLMENCPSPSPICSPVSSHASAYPINLQVSEANTDNVLFVTPNGTSCLTETETKNSSPPDEIQEETFLHLPLDFTFPRPRLQRYNTANFHAHNGRATRFSNQGISQQYVVQEPNEVSESSNSNRDYRQNWQLTTVPSQLSSVGEWNLSPNERFYQGDDEYSPTGSAIELRVREMEAKFKAWKETRNLKFLSRLRKKEEAIEGWEKKQIVKAKQKLWQTEMKLEIKRRRALEKARKKIEKAQKKAQKRKMREQTATAKNILRSNRAFERISCTGKLLWKLGCF